MLGCEIEALVECRNRDEKHLKGRTRCWKNVIFSGDDSLIGTLQTIKVTGFSHQTLIGEYKRLLIEEKKLNLFGHKQMSS